MLKNLKKIFMGLLMGAIVAAGLVATPPQEVLANTNKVPLIRMYNSGLNDHFYTTNRAEANDAAARSGYRLEGDMGYLYATSQADTEPLYRFWNPRASKHFYTTNGEEYNAVTRAGFVLEGVIGYMYKYANDSSPTQIYRLYNRAQNKHFYTVSWLERDEAVRAGYTLEGSLGGRLFLYDDFNVTPPILSSDFILTSSSSASFTPGQYSTATFSFQWKGSGTAQPVVGYSGLPSWASGGTVVPTTVANNGFLGFTVSGTPNTNLGSSFIVTLHDSLGYSESFYLYANVGSVIQLLNITTTSLPTATIGQPYSTQLQASGGVAPYKWSYSNGTNPNPYPTGCCVLGLNGETGLFNTQTSSTVQGPAGTYSWDIQVTDAVGSTTTKLVYLTITGGSQPTLIVSDNFVNFNYVKGGSLPSHYLLHISNNSSNQTINYNISVPSQPAWLNTAYNTSTLQLGPLGTAGIGVSVDTTNLAVGSYYTVIYLSGSFSNSPVAIPVSLWVTN